jgi:hypothetical protein
MGLSTMENCAESEVKEEGPRASLASLRTRARNEREPVSPM